MRIAIVGAGITGIAAAYRLHSHHEVTLIEKNSRIGGHAKTVLAQSYQGKSVHVDTGFIVYNDRNYPNFSKFIRDLGVDSSPSDMAFSYTSVLDGIGYSGTLAGLFPSLKLIRSPHHVGFLWNIYKFSSLLERSAGDYDDNPISIVDALAKLGCPEDVINRYFIPVASAIWLSLINI